MKATQTGIIQTIVGILLVLLLIFLIITGLETVQTKRNTIMTDRPLEPKRVLVDITTEPVDTVYVYDLSEY